MFRGPGLRAQAGQTLSSVLQYSMVATDSAELTVAIVSAPEEASGCCCLSLARQDCQAITRAWGNRGEEKFQILASRRNSVFAQPIPLPTTAARESILRFFPVTHSTCPVRVCMCVCVRVLVCVCVCVCARVPACAHAGGRRVRVVRALLSPSRMCVGGR